MRTFTLILALALASRTFGQGVSDAKAEDTGSSRVVLLSKSSSGKDMASEPNAKTQDQAQAVSVNTEQADAGNATTNPTVGVVSSSSPRKRPLVGTRFERILASITMSRTTAAAKASTPVVAPVPAPQAVPATSPAVAPTAAKPAAAVTVVAAPPPTTRVPPAPPANFPRMYARGNYFLTDNMAQWLKDRGFSLEVSEFYPQSPPNDGPNSDLAKYREGAVLSGEALEQHKRTFPGWNLAGFPLKAAEQGTAWRRDPTRFFTAQLGLRDHSSWNALGSRPEEFKGIILNDYEGWVVDFMAVQRPGQMTPGDRRMLAAMMQAHQALRQRYPNAKLALYGFPFTFAPGLHGSIGQMRSMMNDETNPLLYGSESVAAPRGKVGANNWIASANKLRELDRASAETPELIKFAAECIDMLAPTCYPRAVPNGPATWGTLDHAGGDTPESLANASALGARVRPFANTADFREWNAALHKGRAMTRDGVTSIFFQDPKLPQLGWHTSNYWQSYRAVEIARSMAERIRTQTGRALPIVPVISWHNALSNDPANPVPPLTPAEFEEAIVLPIKEAGVDGVYVWDAYLFPIQVVAPNYDKDTIPGYSVAAMRKYLRQMIVKSGVTLDPSIPTVDEVAADARWKDPVVLRAFLRNVEDAKKRYYEVIAKHFGPETKTAPASTSRIMPTRTGAQRTLSATP